MSHYLNKSYCTVSILVTTSYIRANAFIIRVLMSPYMLCKLLLSLQDSDIPSTQLLANKELVVQLQVYDSSYLLQKKSGIERY
jgi:hypothetical protein